ncbi:NAD(P)-dependent oxidoreductase [Nocardia bovistercoris]|uniref:NAD(P)-dependent oxidoreductase n=1 Tax=Nocardia bovistercoris TaxID=2785916 RepID=A0A931ID34_9NOCA|nr:NAD(P)-dependent oxidoreductase [Nocardia bovistercoris]MBH0779204.1 NAD(P)-dependent oxidoreductase [Nocardia bovistercoris]
MSGGVGFIGLGNMGAPMAKKLLDHPGGLTVCDMRPEVVVAYTDKGATSASSPAEVAERSEVVSVAVVDDAQVRSVIDGADGILRAAKPGTVIAVHSTISDTTAEEMAQLCASHDVEFVDAPVSGGAQAAKLGKLAVMVGGTETGYERVKEPFSAFADLIVHAGPVGAGTRMKLARNLLHFIAFTAATEAQRLAEAAGLDITELGKVVRHSDAITGGAGAIMLRETTAAIPEGDFWLPILSHARDLGEKDLSLALGLGERLGVDLPLADVALGGLGIGLGTGPGAIAEKHIAP